MSTSTTMEELLATAEDLAQIGSWVQELPGREATFSRGMYRILGVAPGEIEASLDGMLAVVHPDDRGRLRKVVEAVLADPGAVPPEGIFEEFRLLLPDGTLRDAVAHGRIEPGSEPGSARWFGVIQDVTEQRLTERDLQAHYALSQALREWESFDEGLVVLLRRLGTALDFQAAALWTLDPSGSEIVCRAFSGDPVAEMREFEAVTRGLRFRPGEPLVGEVWERREPIFVADLASDPRVKRAESTADTGLLSALVFAANAGDETIAVLSFYGTHRVQPSARLIRTLAGIGAHLGRFLARRRAKLQPSPLSPRELEVIALAAEGNTGPEIAARLVVSPSTIKTHFEHIYEKLGVSDRAGAVAHALRIGLIR